MEMESVDNLALASVANLFFLFIENGKQKNLFFPFRLQCELRAHLHAILNRPPVIVTSP